MYNLDEWYKYTKLYVNDYPYWIQFNDHKNTDFGIEVVERPNIPQAKIRLEYTKIPGMDGTLTTTDSTHDDIEIRVPMNYIVPPNVSFMAVTRSVKNWLTGSGKLKLSDDQGFFYKVKNAEIEGNVNRILRRAGTFTALFTCDPFSYLESGTSFVDKSEVELNMFYEAHPIYKITGNGDCIFIVNGTKIEFNVNSNVTINTELMMMYNDNKVLQKAKNRFDYKDLYLKNGTNSIEIKKGFNLKVQPNWRSL